MLLIEVTASLFHPLFPSPDTLLLFMAEVQGNVSLSHRTILTRSQV